MIVSNFKINQFLISLIISLFGAKVTNEEMILVRGNEEIESFYMDKHELTMAKFLQFVEKTNYKTVSEILDSGIVYNPYYKREHGVNWRHDIYGRPIPTERYAELPVTRLALKDAQAYAEWVGKRIPTKEEWIYAARGGERSKSFKYPGGNSARQVGWFDGNSRETLMPVGLKVPNELGLFDMGGNISELALELEKGLVWSMGGSFFTGKDYFEMRYIEDGSYRKIPRSKKYYEGPKTGFRLVTDVQK